MNGEINIEVSPFQSIIKGNMSKEILQPIFDKATAGILAQGVPATLGSSSNLSCAYRVVRDGMPTLKCAVGQILSDEQIEKYGITPQAIPSQFHDELIYELVPGEELFRSVDFLRDLQNAHDNAAFMTGNFLEEFTTLSNRLAEKYGLDPIKR